MSKREWGNATWYLLHTLSYKLKPDQADHVPELMRIFRSICGVLPCPECRQHAISYLNYYSGNLPTDIASLNIFFWRMHNWVNKRLGMPMFSLDECYKKYDLANTQQIVAHFFSVMSRNSNNSKAMLDSFNKSRIINDFSQYVNANAYRFNS